MYKNIKLLSKDDHQGLRFAPHTDYGFARSLKLIPITAGEIKFLCCHYPVVVAELEGRDTLAIITSLDGEHTISINEQGEFIGGYAPAFLRRYPFLLLKDEKTDRAYAALDEDNTCLSSSKGELIFDENGDKTKAAESMLEFMVHLEKEMQMTEKILHVLKASEVLEPSEIIFGHKDEEKKISGFMVISKEKLSKQNDDFFIKAFKEGWTELIELHLLSLSNFQRFKNIKT